MSRELDEARRMVNERLRQAGDLVAYGTIESVDEAARTCDVKVGGIVYEGVLLYATENKDLKGLAMVPKIGSTVLISRVATSSRMYVEMFSEIDKLLLTVGDKLELTIDVEGVRLRSDTTTMQAIAGGFTITRGNSGLKKTLGDLCDAISRLTVSTGTGPSGTPINIAEFTTIKQDLENYLNG